MKYHDKIQKKKKREIKTQGEFNYVLKGDFELVKHDQPIKGVCNQT